MAYPKIFDSNNIELATLNNITSNSLKRRVNSFYEFNFQCYEEEFKSEYIQFENYIQTDGDAFDIAYINESDVNNSPYYDVKCEHVFYRLHDDATKKNNYALSGTPTEILTDLLSGTDFTVGTVDFTSNIVYAVNREATVMNIVISLANTLGAEIGFSNNGFTVDLLNTIGQNNGVEVRIKKNIKGISKSIDKRGVDKTSYKIDLVDVHNSEEYKDLTMIETLDIGDTFQLIDETLGINISQSVLEIEKDVIKESITNITTSNNFDLLDDKLSYIEETAVKKDEIIYGIKINENVGLEIERDDKLARTKLNADEFRMQTGDGGGSYTDALYFDPINKEYIYVGKITVTSGSGIGNFTDAGNLATLDTITTTEITDDAVTTPKIFANAVTTDKVAADAITANEISVTSLSAINADLGTITAGSIDIGSGTFKVDSLGNATANSLTIGGGYGIANLTDSGALATLNSISGTYIDDNSITTPKISVTQLSGISADLGTITAGTISAVTINGATIDIDDSISVGNSVNIGVNDNGTKILQFTQGATTGAQITFNPSADEFVIQSALIGNVMEILSNDDIVITANGDVTLSGTNIELTGALTNNGSAIGGGVELTSNSPETSVYMWVDTGLLEFYRDKAGTDLIGGILYD